MLKLTQLYTDPQTIDPIFFKDGLNIILGERDDTSNKTNGVGKSLCVEFINFALLKRLSGSRLAQIPEVDFSYTTKICLKFSLNNRSYEIRRSIQASETPELLAPDGSIVFSKLDDAVEFLTQRLFEGCDEYPSFRAMLGPLIRDERSEFKSLIQCYDTKQRIPENFEPHLYLFGISISNYLEVKRAIKEHDDLSADSRRVKDNVKLLRGKDMKDARSDLNELDRQVVLIQNSIDALENRAGYEAVKDDLIALETRIEELRRQRSILRFQLRRLRPIEESVRVETNEVVEFYSQLDDSLGEAIKRDLDEVLGFKGKIEEFQDRLLNERREVLAGQLRDIDRSLAILDTKYSQALSVLDQGGNLRNLRQTYAAHKKKSDELAQLRSFVERYDQIESEKQRTKSDKENALLELQLSLTEVQPTIKAFEQFVLSMHEYIQGNRKASFEIKIVQTKQVVDFVMRIDDDGSRSNEREKVFMYDASLLLCPEILPRHPGFLIHDNIFDVDDDTLSKSIGFLLEKADFSKGQQYVLTLNSDQLYHLTLNEDALGEVRDRVRARFTKSKRFLKIKYQQKDAKP